MSDAYKYTTLITSLPHQPALFTEKQTVISRIGLENRLTMLEEEDARTLRLLEQTLAWLHQEFELPDAEVVRRAKRALEQLPDGLIHDVALWRLELRTVVAALRRRQSRLPAPGGREVWGHGRWVGHIRRHWSEPDFRLAGVFPWVGEANRLLAAADTIGLQRLLLTEVWQHLGRIGDEHEFDFVAVVVYVLRWNVIERWTRYDAEQAAVRFDELVTEGLGEFADLPQ